MGAQTTKCYDGRGKDEIPGAVTDSGNASNGSASTAKGGTAAVPATTTSPSAGGMDDPSSAASKRGQHEIAMMAIVTKVFETSDIDGDRKIGSADWAVLNAALAGGNAPAPSSIASRKMFNQFALMHGVTPPKDDSQPLWITRDEYLKYYKTRMEQMLDAEFPGEIVGLREQLESMKTKIAAVKPGVIAAVTAAEAAAPAPSTTAVVTPVLSAAEKQAAADAAAAASDTKTPVSIAPDVHASAGGAGTGNPLFARAVTTMTIDARDTAPSVSGAKPEGAAASPGRTATMTGASVAGGDKKQN